MRILFLDLDGVLNSDQWYQTKTAGKKDFLEGQFDSQAKTLLNDLLDTIDAQIALPSSWRLNFDLQEMNALFSKVVI